MGKIGGKYCDTIYLTDDNPRTENPKLIRSQIKKGLKQKDLMRFPEPKLSRLQLIN